MRHLITFALTGAIISSPATGTADPTAQIDAPKEKKICRKDVATGSVMVKKTCRTKAEWDALAAQGRDQMEKMRGIDSNQSFTRQSSRM